MQDKVLKKDDGVLSYYTKILHIYYILLVCVSVYEIRVYIGRMKEGWMYMQWGIVKKIILYRLAIRYTWWRYNILWQVWYMGESITLLDGLRYSKIKIFQQNASGEFIGFLFSITRVCDSRFGKLRLSLPRSRDL